MVVHGEEHVTKISCGIHVPVDGPPTRRTVLHPCTRYENRGFCIVVSSFRLRCLRGLRRIDGWEGEVRCKVC